MSAVKHDQGKNRLDLLPWDALLELGWVLTFGAHQKYSAWNWLNGMEWSRLQAALMRHWAAWCTGESKDPETGRSHLAHALFCLTVLVVYEKRGLGTDDRPVWTT